VDLVIERPAHLLALKEGIDIVLSHRTRTKEAAADL